MLEQQDYQKIKQLLDEHGEKLEDRITERIETRITEENQKLEDRIISKVGEMIDDNILPILEDHGEKIENLINEVNKLPDKSFLSDKLIDLKWDMVAYQKKQDERFNLLVKFLRDKKILLKNEVEMLEEFQVFPKQQTVEEILGQ